VGLSMVTKLAPLKLASLLMGVWFFATGIAEFLAGQLAAITGKVGRGELFHLFGGQADFYFMFVAASLVSAVLLAALTPWLKRMMQGSGA
jgi:dipeptide/tripeptide permease